MHLEHLLHRIIGVLLLLCVSFIGFSQEENVVREEYSEKGKLIKQIFFLSNDSNFTKVITYYERGAKESEIHFKNGMKEGIVRTWYENGNKWQELEYRNNEHIGISNEYCENGNIKQERYIYGYSEVVDEPGLYVSNGITKNYDVNGVLLEEIFIDGGFRIEKRITYYKTGKISSIKSYNSTLQNGISSFYNSKGRLVKEEFWKNDILKEIKDY